MTQTKEQNLFKLFDPFLRNTLTVGRELSLGENNKQVILHQREMYQNEVEFIFCDGVTHFEYDSFNKFLGNKREVITTKNEGEDSSDFGYLINELYEECLKREDLIEKAKVWNYFEYNEGCRTLQQEPFKHLRIIVNHFEFLLGEDGKKNGRDNYQKTLYLLQASEKVGISFHFLTEKYHLVPKSNWANINTYELYKTNDQIDSYLVSIMTNSDIFKKLKKGERLLIIKSLGGYRMYPLKDKTTEAINKTYIQIIVDAIAKITKILDEIVRFLSFRSFLKK